MALKPINLTKTALGLSGHTETPKTLPALRPLAPARRLDVKDTPSAALPAGSVGPVGSAPSGQQGQAVQVVQTAQQVQGAEFSAIAQTDLNAGRLALLSSGRGKDVSGAGAVGAAVIGALVDQATQAARRLAPTASDIQAAQVWADILESLNDGGIVTLGDTVPLFCSRSGRRIGSVQPDFWLDDLRGIAALGETSAGDTARGRLLGGILAQLAYAVSPVLAVQSIEANALLRETDPRAYLVAAIGFLFPAPKRADCWALARRCSALGKVRQDCALLPLPVIQYACEVVTLFLGHVQPALLPSDINLLSHYSLGFGTICETVPSLGHFTGRLVSMIFTLIGNARLRPVDKLTRSDLLALRVHWKGSPIYAGAKAGRAMLRAAMVETAPRLFRVVTIDGKRVRIMASAADLERQRVAQKVAAADMSLDFTLSDLLDLQSAAGAMGRTVPLSLTSKAELTAAQAKKQAAQVQAAALLDQDDESAQDDLGALDLDLSALLIAGVIPDEFAGHFETESDLINAGLFTLEEVLDFDYIDQDDDETDDDETEVDFDTLQADLLNQAIEAARPVTLRPIRR